MKTWKVIYYETAKKECYIQDFIDSTNKKNQAKILALIGALEEHGINLHRPYADILRDGIHELRLKLSGSQVRVLYFFRYQKYIVLTHAFAKTTGRVPKQEIEKAISYREDFFKRFSEKKIKELLK